MENQKKPVVYGLVASFLYLALFFPSFYVSFLVPGLFENPNMTGTIGVILVFLSVLVPCAIVASIGLIWFMYFRDSLKLMLFFCFFPIIVSCSVLFVFFLIRVFCL
jgi:hypothetical protein